MSMYYPCVVLHKEERGAARMRMRLREGAEAQQEEDDDMRYIIKKSSFLPGI